MRYGSSPSGSGAHPSGYNSSTRSLHRAVIFENYTSLLEDQRESLEKTHRDAVQILNPSLKSRTPKIVLNNSVAMNYAFYKKIDEITGSGFFNDFKRAPSSIIGKRLFKSIGGTDTGLGGDIALVNEWADMLQMKDWFRWADFEQIPPDYEARGF